MCNRGHIQNVTDAQNVAVMQRDLTERLMWKIDWDKDPYMGMRSCTGHRPRVVWSESDECNKCAISWSFPMILFVGSTVWGSLVIFRMSWLGPAAVLKLLSFLTLKPLLLSLPTRVGHSCTWWNLFPGFVRSNGIVGYGLRTNSLYLSVGEKNETKVWKSWFTFPGLKTFNLFCPNSWTPSYNRLWKTCLLRNVLL